LGQEFVIKSQQIEDKINQLLPSQAGFQAGVDFSASTTVIPIVDLTETAEGSSLRQDLQTAVSHNSITAFTVTNTTTTIVTTTGYYRVFGYANLNTDTGAGEITFLLNDGTTDKEIFRILNVPAATDAVNIEKFDFVAFISAGDSLKCKVTNAQSFASGSTRQIADISGNLVNP
jgi:hypothetical protein